MSALSPLLIDEVMMFAALSFLAFLIATGIILARWRDPEIIWIIVLALLQIVAVAYYFLLYLKSNSPIVPFPEVGITIRPYLLGLWLLIASYCAIRLHEKRLFRK